MVDIDFDYVKPSYFMSLASQLLPVALVVISLLFHYFVRIFACFERRRDVCEANELVPSMREENVAFCSLFIDAYVYLFVVYLFVYFKYTQ